MLYQKLKKYFDYIKGITLFFNSGHCTEVRIASLFSGGFIIAIVIKPPERKLAKCISVHCARKGLLERLCFHNMKIVKNECTLVSLFRITTKKIRCTVNHYVNIA